MSVFSPLPLGQRIPPSLHGVSVSLPTMDAVIGYETKRADIVAQMPSGYPRFVKHPFLKQAAAHVLRARHLEGRAFWPTSSERAADALRGWLNVPEAETLSEQGLTGVAFPDKPETFARAKTFLQHTGMLASSREAEDYLVRVGVLSAPAEEPSFEGYAASRVKGALARAFRAAPDDVFLANSGMNAVYTAFRVADSVQRKRGRHVWIQLGWLYLDTIALLQKFTQDPASDYIYLSDVFDLAALRTLFRRRGSEIAGIITEVPTNPMLQTADIETIHYLCRANGSVFIVDPSVASPFNLDVLKHCDLAVDSLTKYAANEGDVIMGTVAVNPNSPYADEFRNQLPSQLEPVYSRDVARLATEIGNAEGVVAQINLSTPKVVEYLQGHPAVREVYWSHHASSRDNYLKLSRTPDSVGCMVSFTLRGPLAPFYDRLRLPKGPSFGMKTTLICPFIYLAHYDLVSSPEGRRVLDASGLTPELLRLSIGCEPVEEIIGALAEALS
ncbi:PLP-dependent transferase [Opitutaceae bacterium EW11]|nr:PLP-dependent transferase [Opitutaceae bacterium EW11]